MKLARLGPVGHEIPVLIDGDRHLDLRGIVTDLDGAHLASAVLEEIAAARDAATLPVLDGAADLRVGAPVARPGAILCIGQNYAAHAAESGAEPPQLPILFLKSTNSVSGPFDEVDIPKRSVKTDWEVELGVVIGTRALYLDSPADSARHIAGYVTANDLSERDFQLAESGGQWSKGKSAPGFTPLGPWLVTADEVDASELRLRSWVNGGARQDSTTADLIFDVDYLVWHLSQYLALDPGDVILTGTPEGVALSGRFPYIAQGDVVEVEIEGLGRQRQLFGQA
ncbi:fumarylacetoacetate hydrolase family protein [Agreia pratensis]|uniref:2-keto-4-pentenoate hydratase/2-oxohepta-3-ene-1,7-dioic acid hydratase (Catechol pathway) n=1 Tax=Agreia pratensis TaxID=150121 RepID=A0A1X7L329_9MICO|nr:fumarylacetoacetate hydrolase family protein [Agreia pratensis]MBF4636177.1 fumarylacetoacetate hydrolase family protein [Agreia pratensis]SMG48105.1 2-keto-4-pentenoate hydratase/2-oxohepta-3-ene-1,7-dioic acid hydratase (catechol pathway) [Agreia pratensis]